MTEITAQSRYLRTSPKKVRLLANLIRKKKVDEAMNILEFSSQKGSKFLLSLFKSALKTAKDKDLEPERLQIAKLTVNQGPRLKRSRPGSRGRLQIYQHPTTHLGLVLSEKKEIELKAPPKKSTKPSSIKLKENGS